MMLDVAVVSLCFLFVSLSFSFLLSCFPFIRSSVSSLSLHMPPPFHTKAETMRQLETIKETLVNTRTSRNETN